MRIPRAVPKNWVFFEFFEFNLLRRAAHLATCDCKGQNQSDHGVSRVPVPKRRMRDVKGDGKDEGERGQRKEVRAAGKKEPCQPDDNCKQSDGIPKKDEAYEKGVG